MAQDKEKIYLAIYINNGRSDEQWVNRILDGTKTIETRSSKAWRNFKRVLDRHGGWRNQRIAFIYLKTPYFVATLSDVIEYRTREQFESDYDRHLVGDGSSVYDNSVPEKAWDDDNKRVGLVLKDVVDIHLKMKPLELGNGPKSYLDLEQKCIEIVEKR